MEISRKIKAMIASKQGPDLRAAGYSAHDLLAAGCSVSDLRSAGYSVSDLRSAGYSASALLAAGYSASVLLAAGYSADNLRDLDAMIPMVEKPYSRIWEGIKSGKLKHDQSTFGPDADPQTNLCKTQMCTAGHLVNMGGLAGFKLKSKFGFSTAASLIHYKAHPGWPCQDFGAIKQEWALAYIEEMACLEAAESGSKAAS